MPIYDFSENLSRTAVPSAWVGSDFSRSFAPATITVRLTATGITAQVFF
ncbi:hypothetical protein [Acetobacterium wieringae]|nr:hypothetical protein [Acetobacterium wieringae]